MTGATKLRKGAKSRWLFGLAVAAGACLAAWGPVFAEAPEGGTAVDSGRLIANMHRPQGEGPFPAVLLLGGSGGGIGWQDAMGALMVQDGVVGMALAYFGLEGLPSQLERIPIEYVVEALNHLEQQPFVDPTRIAVVGVSKGAELALLVASKDPRLKAVVAFVPSSAVFQSIATGWPTTSSWSIGGEDVAFVPYRITENFRPDRLTVMYGESLDQPQAAEAAIQVENIKGPILLLSAKDDALWPSTRMSEQIVARLASHGFEHEVEHIAYAEAGHLISRITEDATRLGGTAAGNRKAQEDAQQRMRAFLTRHLGAGT